MVFSMHVLMNTLKYQKGGVVCFAFLLREIYKINTEQLENFETQM